MSSLVGTDKVLACHRLAKLTNKFRHTLDATSVRSVMVLVACTVRPTCKAPGIPLSHKSTMQHFGKTTYTSTNNWVLLINDYVCYVAFHTDVLLQKNVPS